MADADRKFSARNSRPSAGPAEIRDGAVAAADGVDRPHPRPGLQRLTHQPGHPRVEPVGLAELVDRQPGCEA